MDEKESLFSPVELMTLPQEKPSILDHGGAVAINRHFHGDVLKRSLWQGEKRSKTSENTKSTSSTYG